MTLAPLVVPVQKEWCSTTNSVVLPAANNVLDIKNTKKYPYVLSSSIQVDYHPPFALQSYCKSEPHILRRSFGENQSPYSGHAFHTEKKKWWRWEWRRYETPKMADGANEETRSDRWTELVAHTRTSGGNHCRHHGRFLLFRWWPDQSWDRMTWRPDGQTLDRTLPTWGRIFLQLWLLIKRLLL